MAKTKMSEWRREALIRFATDNMDVKKEEAKHRKAFDRAFELVEVCIEKRFPKADMEVLQRYGFLYEDRCIKGGTPDGAFVVFNIPHLKEFPCFMMPNRGCSSNPVAFDRKTVDAIIAYDKAVIELQHVRNDKLRKYRDLLRSVTYVEDVFEVWPAAKQLADKLCNQPSTSLMVLTDDLKNFIKKDNAGAELESV